MEVCATELLVHGKADDSRSKRRCTGKILRRERGVRNRPQIERADATLAETSQERTSFLHCDWEDKRRRAGRKLLEGRRYEVANGSEELGVVASTAWRNVSDNDARERLSRRG